MAFILIMRRITNQTMILRLQVKAVLETDIPVIEIEDFSFYEVFRCQADEIYQTWQLIWKKEQQGLLKRAYSVDFEKYHPDGLVEIYIAVEPHC